MKTPIKKLIDELKKRQEDDESMPFMWNYEVIELLEKILPK